MGAAAGETLAPILVVGHAIWGLQGTERHSVGTTSCTEAHGLSFLSRPIDRPKPEFRQNHNGPPLSLPLQSHETRTDQYGSSDSIVSAMASPSKHPAAPARIQTTQKIQTISFPFPCPAYSAHGTTGRSPFDSKLLCWGSSFLIPKLSKDKYSDDRNIAPSQYRFNLHCYNAILP